MSVAYAEQIPIAERPHGTRARYMFGPFGSDTANGCRCDSCRRANTLYAQDRKKRAALARVGVGPPAMVSAEAVRLHMQALSAAGMGRRAVAEHSGVSLGAIEKIRRGDTLECTHSIATAILGLKPVLMAGTKVDGEPTFELIDALLAAGVRPGDLGRIVHGPDAVRLSHELIHHTRQQVRAVTAAKVAELVHTLIAVMVGMTADTVRLALAAEDDAELDGVSAEERAELDRLIQQRTKAVVAGFWRSVRSTGSWQDAAVCAGLPGDAMFPGLGQATAPAKGLCAVCPVVGECLDAALDNNERHGIWGGTSARERRTLRRQRRREDAA